MPAILFERAHFGGFSLESPTTSRHIAYVTLLKRTVGPRVLSLSLQGSFEKIASLPLRFWHCFLFLFGFPSTLPLRFWHVIYIFFRESPLLRALRRCRSYTKRAVGGMRCIALLFAVLALRDASLAIDLHSPSGKTRSLSFGFQKVKRNIEGYPKRLLRRDNSVLQLLDNQVRISLPGFDGIVQYHCAFFTITNLIPARSTSTTPM